MILARTLLIKLTGFKPARYRQWKELLLEEGRTAGWHNLAWDILKALVRGRLVSPKLWRARVRICTRCPIFSKTLHRCRPYPSSPLGCGCTAFVVALTLPQCWAKEHLPDSGLGW